ncbi:MAG: diguanylate cyclase [Proteobacteria bacterium]|nr:diguanylate cyclase [Pseudomonadota bacterium]
MRANDGRPKILIVDDETINIDSLVALLNPDYRTVAAKDGPRALGLLKKKPLPDLILLDVMMPGMDGYEVCRMIKEHPATRDIPAIFITGRNDEQDEARGFQSGAVDYIAKPFSPLIALARVRTHVELKRRGDMLARLAGQDGLTGIPNRRRFDGYLASEWKRSLRYGHPISVILVDIGFFKFYNDHYGHAEGDVCLKAIARALSRSMTRSEDLAARYGVEEFECILAETTDQGARTVADRILENVRALDIPPARSSVADHVTVSVGLAGVTPALKDQALELVKKADEALCRAKRQGRNRLFHCSVRGETAT